MTSTATTPTQREQLEYALVSGAAAYIASHAHEAEQIADGIQKVLNKLHPLPVVDPGLDSLEREIQAKANKAPRVTPAC